MVEDLRQEVPLKLSKERQRVLSNPNFFRPLKQLYGPNVDFLKVDLVNIKYFATDEISLFVNSANLDDLVWREER